MNKKLLTFGAPLLALLLGLMFYLGLSVPQQQSAIQRSSLGGDFTLTAQTGPVSLSDFRGGPVLIYFGFTSCPDICPTSLAVMRQMFANLTEAERAQVNGIFISVDPARDTLDHLQSYTQFFSPKIRGVTGSKEEIDQVVRQYGAFYRFVKLEDSAMEYTVDHSSRIYLADANGALVDTLAHDIDPQKLTERVRALLTATTKDAS